MKATLKVWGSEKVCMVMFCLLNKQKVFGLEKVAYFDLRQVFRSMDELQKVGVKSFCGIFPG